MRGLGQCGVGTEGTAQDTTRNGYKDLGICLDMPRMHVCKKVYKNAIQYITCMYIKNFNV